jgi:L-alanine-DL-glutamate epimerase-like enolase superfamily enzyme
VSGTAHAYTIPTDAPEADGTFFWDATTLIVVELDAGEAKGLGYTYSHKVAAPLLRDLIKHSVIGKHSLDIGSIFKHVRQSQRNYGSDGIAATALSALDVALWDLKAKLLNTPLATLLGQVRDGAPVYGSGGFTSYSRMQLETQLAGWIAKGITRVKMKVGSDPGADLARVASARRAIGEKAELFVDANGAYSRKQALDFAERFHADYKVTWFEEPVTSDDLYGLRLLCDRAPAGMDIAAGEYGWSTLILHRMIAAEAVDVIQADATRCGGITGFMEAAALAKAHPLPLSAHCAPSIHMHLACAAPTLRHVEYFHDHARIEHMLFEGFRRPEGGVMYPDLSAPGLGLSFRHQDAEHYKDDV